MTRLLTRTDLQAVLEPMSCISALSDGFRTAAGRVAGQRVRTDLPFSGTATALIPGVLPGIEAYTVKVNAKFPGAQPALRGVICLHSGQNGELLALMDSATITAWRTGLAAAVGTHRLAGPVPGDNVPGDNAVLGVIGAGAQAELMVSGLNTMRRHRALVVYDTDPARAATFASRHGGHVRESVTAIASEADIVLLATWSDKPLLHLADTRPGQHFTSLGADEPGKQELSADLLESALLVVDDRELAADMGALAAAGLAPSAADATLGDILRGEHPGRTTATARSVYAPVGLPWQDLALAWDVYQQAQRHDIGQKIDLLS